MPSSRPFYVVHVCDAADTATPTEEERLQALRRGKQALATWWCEPDSGKFSRTMVRRASGRGVPHPYRRRPSLRGHRAW
jgi:hypothetical protein